MRILLIEDDEHVAEVLADAFAADGHETAITHTGEEGLAYLARERPDAVVAAERRQAAPCSSSSEPPAEPMEARSAEAEVQAARTFGSARLAGLCVRPRSTALRDR